MNIFTYKIKLKMVILWLNTFFELIVDSFCRMHVHVAFFSYLTKFKQILLQQNLFHALIFFLFEYHYKQSSLINYISFFNRFCTKGKLIENWVSSLYLSEKNGSKYNKSTVHIQLVQFSILCSFLELPVKWNTWISH